MAAQDTVEEAFKKIAQIPLDDGFEITFLEISLLDHPDMPHPGFRILVKVKLIEGRLTDNLQIDVGIGDNVTPNEQSLNLMTYRSDPLYESSISLLVYPPENIFAEKLNAVFAKGEDNSRMKDFNDLILMSRQPEMLNMNRLKEAIISTFKYQKSKYHPPIEFTAPIMEMFQESWDYFLSKQALYGFTSPMPHDFAKVLAELNKFIAQIDVSQEDIDN